MDYLHLIYEGKFVPKARARTSEFGTVHKREYRQSLNDLICSFRQQVAYDFPLVQKGWILMYLEGDHQRKGDADNLQGTILDALVDADILAQDNLNVVEDVCFFYSNINKTPTASIYIYPRDNKESIISTQILRSRIQSIEENLSFTIARQGDTHEKILSFQIRETRYIYQVFQKYRYHKDRKASKQYLQGWFLMYESCDLDDALRAYQLIDYSKSYKKNKVQFLE